jgi:hypothetical protein
VSYTGKTEEKIQLKKKKRGPMALFIIENLLSAP